MQVFLTEGYLGIVMEYVNGGDMADLVDTWNARNRRRRPPPGTVSAGTQYASKAQKSVCMPYSRMHVNVYRLLGNERAASC